SARYAVRDDVVKGRLNVGDGPQQRFMQPFTRFGEPYRARGAHHQQGLKPIFETSYSLADSGTGYESPQV
ncbi:hypothetical protein MKR41_12105, partial [Staphylococcus haemolyticus]